jgi:hypothetical protein
MSNGIPDVQIQNVMVEKPLDQLLTEPELEEFFGQNRTQIDYLRRYKQLPFVQITLKKRLYFVSDVLEWCRRNRKVLNVAEMD